MGRLARLSRARPWLATALIAAVARLPAFVRPLLDDDEAQYAATAELVRAGGRLYADGGVDNKPPGIYWTYAAVFDVAVHDRLLPQDAARLPRRGGGRPRDDVRARWRQPLIGAVCWRASSTFFA